MAPDQSQEESVTVADANETSLATVSESRVRILKALEDTRRTVSELGRQLELNKSTVHSHIQGLVEDDLVRREDDEDRLWVYYTLTRSGREIVKTNKLRFVVDISSFVAILGSLSLLAYRFLFQGRQQGTGGGQPGPWTPPAPEAGVPWVLLAAGALLLLGLGCLALRYHLTRRTVPAASA